MVTISVFVGSFYVREVLNYELLMFHIVFKMRGGPQNFRTITMKLYQARRR